MTIGNKLLFQGKTAVITGGSGALGKAYAFDLAKRGANVVVSDIVESNEVVKEINNFGGTAIANNMGVLDGKLIISEAIKHFGKVDILINNAGILRDKSFHKMSLEEWQEVLNVHLMGTFQLSHAVWPYMQQNKYGRIINIGSGAGLYGNFGQANYSAAKMGILGLTNTLAIEGEKYGINVNCVIPVAGSKMTENVLSKDILELLSPKHISPFVTYLSHESCNESGQVYEIGGGWYSKIRLQRSSGRYLGNNSNPATAEIISENINNIGDFSKFTYPKVLSDSIKDMIKSPDNLDIKSNIKSSNNEIKNISQDNNKLECDDIMEKIRLDLEKNPIKFKELIDKVNANVTFVISNKNETIIKTWHLDLKSSIPTLQIINTNESNNIKSDVKIKSNDKTFLSLIKGLTSPEMAYMTGQMIVKGNPTIALKIKSFLEYTKTIN